MEDSIKDKVESLRKEKEKALQTKLEAETRIKDSAQKLGIAPKIEDIKKKKEELLKNKEELEKSLEEDLKELERLENE